MDATTAQFPPGQSAPSASAPGPQTERITSLDVLRGFAVLGILLMNIVGFGLYYQAYDNPTSAGGADGLNLAAWIILHITAEGTMRCLFSMIFGASMVLFLSRLDGRSEAADLYYRRILWLMVFGVAHLFLLWHGEILYLYAILALVLYPFRNLRAKTLILIGLAALMLLTGFGTIRAFNKRDLALKAEAAAEKVAMGETLTREEEAAQREWEEFLNARNPSPEDLARDAEPWRGSFISVVKARGDLVIMFLSIPYFHPIGLDMWGMMFIGMGLMKLGVLSGAYPVRFYLVLLLAGYGLGFSVNSYTAWLVTRSEFDPVVQQFSAITYQPARLLVAGGHLALLLILCQKGWLRWLTSRLGAAGQMAFTNYVMQSVICAFIFTGYGLGLYGTLERYQLYYVVGAIWVLQLALSPVWLAHFRYGPLEWGWRSLTYWQLQPFRRITPQLQPPRPTPVPA